MMKLFTEIDRRLGIGDLVQCLGPRAMPGGASWTKVWASVFAFAAFVQVVTGFFLWMYYSPGAQSAWESVYYVQYHVAGGWLLRAVHHYSAHVTIALSIVYLVQLVVTAGYRAPRELVFWAGMGIGIVALCGVLTGDLLHWDQNGFASTKVRTSFLNLLPGIGASLLALATGGGEFGHLTLTRFMALHVGLFGSAMIAMVAAHYWLARRADTAEAPTAKVTTAKVVEPWWPHQASRNAVAALVFMAIVMALALQHGWEGPHRGVAQGSPPDLTTLYKSARPEWMLMGVYELAQIATAAGVPGIVPIFVVPGLIVFVGLLMPWLARAAIGQAFNMLFTVCLLAGLVGLTIYSYAKDVGNPEHLAGIAAERVLADRVRELADAKGIPASGAITLLRDDAKTQGPLLFKQHCASCHSYSAPGDRAIVSPSPSAPDLFGFATRRWISGFLSAEKITSADYFGNTAFKSGEMVGTVKDWAKQAKEDPDLQADLEAVVLAISAEAGLPAQKEIDQAEAAKIAEAKETVGAMCVDCHRYYEAKGAGAPDLTGYGSLAWARAIIANPAHPRFYGDDNDRMPAYEQTLTPHEIDLLASWLRGEWFEPAAAASAKAAK